MSEALPTVSVVMATYNRRALLPEVVDALLADPATTELVVIVDGCRDGSFEYLENRAARDSRVKPVFTENRGAAAAQQLGIEQAAGDVVLLFDDDQIAGADMVTGHARHHAAHDGDVVVGYVPVTSVRMGDIIVGEYAAAYESDVALWQRDPSTILGHLWGGALSLRREALARVPWLDPAFDLGYHYDGAFGLRCADAGMTAVFDPTLRARHLYERTVAGMVREAYVKGCAMARHERMRGRQAPFHNLSSPHNPLGRMLAIALFRRPRLIRATVVTADLAARFDRLAPITRGLAHALWVAEARRGYADDAGT